MVQCPLAERAHRSLTRLCLYHLVEWPHSGEMAEDGARFRPVGRVDSQVQLLTKDAAHSPGIHQITGGELSFSFGLDGDPIRAECHVGHRCVSETFGTV
ncbi:Uncharacterised protein [Mycobacteroides abscessus subsp. massiliense]|nr:Uncharacterised protein [Mycobacteroides abscessus subsp. massiliense]